MTMGAILTATRRCFYFSCDAARWARMTTPRHRPLGLE